jgi:peroxiredoxin
MKTTRNIIASATVLALVLVLALAAVFAWPGRPERDAAPDVAYILLDGRQGTLQALRGRVVLVSFWSMNCDTCVNEMPSIVATDAKFRAKGYETLAIAMSYDPLAFVARFVAHNKLPFPVAIDNGGQIAKSFGEVRQTPTAFLIDKRGRIVERFVGAPDFAALQRQIEVLLAEQG